MATENTSSKRPTHDVCHVRGEGQKAYWTTIGAAWLHDDGKGLNLALDFMPVSGNGRLVIRIRKDKNEQPQGEAA